MLRAVAVGWVEPLRDPTYEQPLRRTAEFLAYLLAVLAERRDRAIPARRAGPQRGRRRRGHRAGRRADGDAAQVRMVAQRLRIADAAERDVGALELLRQLVDAHRAERFRDAAVGL